MAESEILRETIVSARACEAAATGPAEVGISTFVSEACGANGFSTGTARFKPGAYLPYHTHGFSEAITIVEGTARVLVEGRAYLLHPQDCIHVPAGVAHRVENAGSDEEMLAHWAFATATPSRELVDDRFRLEDRGEGMPHSGDPENLIRYSADATYELSKNAFFLDLFARRYGSVGICGGVGRFEPGASLPCHIHDFDESITITRGRAVCLVQGRRYVLSGCDTAFIPKGIPHRFLNLSDEDMSMIWVYAGSEPDRLIVDAGFCSGEKAWTGADSA